MNVSYPVPSDSSADRRPRSFADLRAVLPGLNARSWRRWSPYASSLVVHLLLLWLLAMWVLPALQGGADVPEIQAALTIAHPDEASQLQQVSFDIQMTAAPIAGLTSASAHEGITSQQSIPSEPLPPTRAIQSVSFCRPPAGHA